MGSDSELTGSDGASVEDICHADSVTDMNVPVMLFVLRLRQPVPRRAVMGCDSTAGSVTPMIVCTAALANLVWTMLEQHTM